MSQPSFPETNPSLSREDVINQIISSIAMEELGLSHIINTEGEKLQYALGTIPGVTGPTEPASIADLLDLNKSVRETLDSTMTNQMFLKAKLQAALNASVMQGPPGPVGTILGSYKTLDELIDKHPQGQQGDAYLVGGTLYVWNVENSEWMPVGDLTGPTGSSAYQIAVENGFPGTEADWLAHLVGPAGPVGTILNSYPTLADLIANHPEGEQGDAYLVGGELYVWDVVLGGWKSVGDLIGPAGPSAYEVAVEQGFIGTTDEWLETLIGPTGPTGPVGTILNSYPTLADLILNHPVGQQGDAYLVGGVLYVWDATATPPAWKNVGDLVGPAGPTGPTGDSLGTILGVIPEGGPMPPTGNIGDMWVVGDGELYVWNDTTKDWERAGTLSGVQGPTGPAGPVGTILASYNTLDELIAAHPQGEQGDAYLVGGELYIWDTTTDPGEWKKIGSLVGPTGSFDPGESLFTVAAGGGSAQVGFGDTLTFESSTLDIEVTPDPTTVKIESAGYNLQFGSVDSERIEAGGSGARWQQCVVGTGVQLQYYSSDPITVLAPAKTVTMLAGGTITELTASLTTTAAQTDRPISVYAQLYVANRFDSQEFYPVPDTTIKVGDLAYLMPANSLRSGRLTGLSIPIPPGSRLALVFYAESTLLAGTVAFYNGAAVVK